ncbi:MAG: TonB-dependent receptor [Acidobacteria bacterium]|nr:TonB-dependent receptor [Acidobacteriota bacterium]
MRGSIGKLCRRVVSTALLAALGAAGAARAEGAGAVAGRVVSASGDRLPGASLELRGEESGRVVRAASGESGLFRVGGLEPGAWRAVASLPGLPAVAEATFEAEAGREAQLELVVSLPVFEESVTAVAVAGNDTLEAPRLREGGARDVGEALEALPGVWKLRKGGLANEVVVRGAQSRDLAVFVDGQRLFGACPNKMDPATFHADFSEVDRIEVTKGPVDVSLSGAPGGAVRVVTRDPEPGRHFRVELGAGSQAYLNPSAVVSVATARGSALAGAAWRGADPYRTGAGTPFTAVANYAPAAEGERAFEVGTAWAKASFSIDERRELDLSLSAQRADTILYPYLAMDGETDDADRVRLRYRQQREREWTAQVEHAVVDHSMDDALRLTGVGRPRDYSMRTDARSVFTRLTLATGGPAWSGGIELSRRGHDATNAMAMTGYRPSAMIPDAESDLAGAYVDGTRRLGERTTLRFGARLDAVETDAAAVAANLELYRRYHGETSLAQSDLLPGAIVRLATAREPFSFEVGLGHAARAPEPVERYLALVRPASDWVGDPGLEPPRTTTLDARATWEASGARLELAGFASRVDRSIAVVEVVSAAGKGARTWANVDADLVGAELSGSLALPGGWLVAGDLSWVRGRRDALPELGLAAAPLAETPPLGGRLAIRWDDGRWYVEGEEVAAARQTRVDPSLSESPTPGWAVTHLRAGWRRGEWAVSVALSNLFDREYVEHLSYQRDPFRSGVRVPEPGRAWSTHVGYRF